MTKFIELGFIVFQVQQRAHYIQRVFKIMWFPGQVLYMQKKAQFKHIHVELSRVVVGQPALKSDPKCQELLPKSIQWIWYTYNV